MTVPVMTPINIKPKWLTELKAKNRFMFWVFNALNEPKTNEKKQQKTKKGCKIKNKLVNVFWNSLIKIKNKAIFGTVENNKAVGVKTPS